MTRDDMQTFVTDCLIECAEADSGADCRKLIPDIWEERISKCPRDFRSVEDILSSSFLKEMRQVR